MTLIGMPDAAERAGMTRAGVRLALINAGVELVKINANALAVEEKDLLNFIAKRGHSPGRGRPQGAKNKPKEQEVSNG